MHMHHPPSDGLPLLRDEVLELALVQLRGRLLLLYNSSAVINTITISIIIITITVTVSVIITTTISIVPIIRNNSNNVIFVILF